MFSANVQKAEREAINACFFMFSSHGSQQAHGAFEHLGGIILVPSIFGRQQLNSETSRVSKRCFPSQKHGTTFFGRFRRLQLTGEAFKPSCLWENTSERECLQSLRSLPAHEAEGLEGLLNLPFLEDSTKRTGFRSLPKIEDSLPKTVGTKRIRLKCKLYTWHRVK